jgi:predicted AAA+ superfamily ATPase
LLSDIVVPEKRIAIQVCYNVSDAATFERETSALLALNKFRPMGNLMIITQDTERQVELNGLCVDVVPVWKWLIIAAEQNI